MDHHDPIGFEGGQSNFYEYVGNDPANEWDPSGLFQSSVGSDKWKQSLEAGGAIATGALPPDAVLAAGPKGKIYEEAYQFGDQFSKSKALSQVTLNKAGNNRERIENAARHLYWQAMITIIWGRSVADSIGAIHEADDNSYDSLMDEYHNWEGQVIGLKVLIKLAETNPAVVSAIGPQWGAYRRYI